MERILEEEGIEARALTWEQLGEEIGLDCTGRTIKNAMGTMDYHKCIACRKGWVNKKTAENRVKWTDFMLERYPKPEDWYRVRFSDEVHFGWGPQRKLHVIRKPGERYCQDCIQEADEPAEKDKNVTIAGPPQATISNRIFNSTMSLAIQTEKRAKKSILSKF